MAVCVIPARGGSKRIPRKNIRPFYGKPMILWALECAQEADIFSEIVVSTDDEEIRDLCSLHGASIPFLRPAKLADDFTDTVSVIAHAIEEMCVSKSDDNVCCIYPTSPLMKPAFLADTHEIIKSREVDYVVPITEFAYPVERALKLEGEDFIKMVNESAYAKRSQDTVAYWHDVGQFYWGKRAAWLAKSPILNSNSIGYPIPRSYVSDIDTEEDWKIAELLFRLKL